MAMDYKKDSYVFGGIVALFMPLAMYGLLYLILWAVEAFFAIETSVFLKPMRLLAIVFNVLPMRYYFVKLKFDLTGRAILLVTFIYVLVYFWTQ